MDYQTFVNHFTDYATIYKFTRLPDGSFSEIRLMAVNDIYWNFIHKAFGVKEYVTDVPYTRYFTNPNFERLCYRCGETGEPQHMYVNSYGRWLEGYYFLLDSPEDEYYVCYIYRIADDPDPDKMSVRSSDVLSAVLKTSIKLHQNSDFTAALTETAKSTKEIFHIGQCIIILNDDLHKTCHFITEQGLIDDSVQKLFRKYNFTMYNMISKCETLLAGSDSYVALNESDFEMLKGISPIGYQILKSRNTNTFILYKMEFNHTPVGFIYIGDFQSENIDLIKETIDLLSFYVGSVAANHILMNRMEFLSTTDMLTGVKNRNAMNTRIDYFDESGSIGVAFIDLNGLKKVNDTGGHEAGDSFIVESANILKEIFSGYEIYRAGGDEFLAICPGIDGTDFESRIDRLKSDEKFAIGSAYGTSDIHTLISFADKLMYAEKDKYYQKYPERRR